MNDTLKELAAMAKRFCEIFLDRDAGLCGIGWSPHDGPYVQLNETAFKRAFQEYETDENPGYQNRELYTMQDDVRFITLEPKIEEI